MKIQDVKAREILDSRGNPTIEVDVITESGVVGRYAAPSGASVGKKEAIEKRDADTTRFDGKGVIGAIDNVHQHIKDRIVGLDVSDQQKIDDILIELGGTRKEKMGANATIATSIACAEAAAKCANIPLFKHIGNLHNSNKNPSFKMPRMMMNFVNGGVHAKTMLLFQEFMIVPETTIPVEALELGYKIFRKLAEVLKEELYQIPIGDEGGYASEICNANETLMLLKRTIERCGYKLGVDVHTAMDIAANELYNPVNQKYLMEKDPTRRTFIELKREEMVDYYRGLSERYGVISVEDGIIEDDLEGWQYMTKTLEEKRNMMVVGDDVFATNYELLMNGINQGAANAILIKPNQIGTLSETLQTIQLAQTSHYKVIISHRSGETESSMISHLAVGVSADYIKAGSVCRGERVAKYNELIRIAEMVL